MESSYFGKFAGAGAAGVPVPPWSNTGWSMLNSFTGMAVLGLVHAYFVAPDLHHPLLIAAFGAMSVLLFSAVAAPASQPYNTIVGNSIGALVGVLVVSALRALGLETMFWLSGALSVSLTIVVQELTNSQHPPGGATALIFAIIMPMHKEGFSYILTPALLGAVIMVLVATIMNNLSSSRQYPQFWNPIQAAAIVARECSGEVPAESTSEEEPSMMQLYFKKFKGAGKEAAPKPQLTEVFFSFLGSFAGMAVLGLLHTYVFQPYFKLTVEVAAFGAMSVLIFSLGKAPLSQPVNVIFGNSLGGAVGVVTVQLMTALGLEKKLWLAGAISVSATIGMQERTGTVHPPGGATALLYAITPPLQTMGAIYVFAPAALGAVIMVIMGVIMNNMSPARCYPQRWLNDDTPTYSEELHNSDKNLGVKPLQRENQKVRQPTVASGCLTPTQERLSAARPCDVKATPRKLLEFLKRRLVFKSGLWRRTWQPEKRAASRGDLKSVLLPEGTFDRRECACSNINSIAGQRATSLI